MSVFNDANQVRLALKMKLSNYSWYMSSRICTVEDGFGVVIGVNRLDNTIRKLVAPVVDGISIKVELE